jgi:hypothetical protein
MKQLFSFFILFQFCFIPSFSQSSVWLIEGNDSKIYVGGTIHRLREKDYPLPKEFYDAYNHSEILVTESDDTQHNTAVNAKKLRDVTLYTDEKTLKSVLNETVYYKLDSVCKQYKIDLTRMSKYKPSLVISSLTYQALRTLDASADGVERHFINIAVKDNKSFLYLESFDDQLNFWDNIGKGNENEFVLHSLEDINENNESFEELIECWRHGNEEFMLEQINEFKKDFPKLYLSLLVERNRSWIPHLEAYLETPEVEFVLFGALHLYGPEGVIQKMKEKGYKVLQLKL